MKLQAIGVVEINYFTNAVIALDVMCKAADVQLVSMWKTLGGRMVHVIVSGNTAEVNSAIEALKNSEDMFSEKALKVAITISNPHSEVVKLLNQIGS